MHYVYNAKLEKNPDGGFLAIFPDVPEAIASGPDRASALAEAREALAAGLLFYAEDGEPLPTPTSRSGTPVGIAAQTALKLAVMDAFQSAGISKSELARRLGKAEGEARRILDARHATKAPVLEAALAALGKRVTIMVDDAA